MSQPFYRFRPTGALLDKHEELKRQEIYFASPKELKDPLEGFKDIYWKGDPILWSNLITHYLLCLTQTVLSAILFARDDANILDRSYVFSTPETLPVPEIRDLFGQAKLMFWNVNKNDRLPLLLSARLNPVRRNELITYLRTIHFSGLKAILHGMEQASLIPPSSVVAFSATGKDCTIDCESLIEMINRQEREDPKNLYPGESIGEAAEATSLQQNLMLAYNAAKAPGGEAWQAIVCDFPSRYVIDLEQLLHGDWYAACFVGNPENASMWSTYGDGHKGVCLKFGAHTDLGARPSLKLNQIIGMRAGKNLDPHTIRGDAIHEFEKIEYEEKFIGIDFFQSLGMVTHPMLQFWCRDEMGKSSALVGDLLSQTSYWRVEYWNNLRRVITTKLSDWQHECEYRLTLQSIMLDFQEPATRKLNYQFEDLEAIIFGMKTSSQDKTAIMRIIANKCRSEGRKEFEFYQATYSALKGKMEVTFLPLLKIA